nr:MAG TPA: hypothetical protein [Caudoviricetes sp.]DAR40486.1 MAG TPA: hypothetical protein [Caudoviricetes sp.]
MTSKRILWLRICHSISHALLFGMLIMGSMMLIIIYVMDLFM